MEEHSLFGLEEDEDEQGYVREGEELEDIYEDDELSELEGEELEKTLKLPHTVKPQKLWHEGLNIRLLIRHIFLYLVIKGSTAKSMLTLNL